VPRKQAVDLRRDRRRRTDVNLREVVEQLIGSGDNAATGTTDPTETSGGKRAPAPGR
jgi:hypothetical protein